MTRSDDLASLPTALGAGLVAGLAGTAAMTAAQTAYYKALDTEGSTTPAEVGRRVIHGVLQRGVSDSEQRTQQLNTAMHWLYGTTWGVLYGLAARRPGRGVTFGAVVWAASLVELPAMQLSPPVWEMPPSSIAPDAGFHLLYGIATAHALRIARAMRGR